MKKPATKSFYISLLSVHFENLERRALLSSAAPLFVEPALSLHSSAISSSIDGYSPADIRKAYGFDQLSAQSTGAGQTIAIVDAYNDPNIAADLKAFDKQFGLSDPPSLKQVSQTGSTSALPRTDAGWAQEISLDVEWAHAIAPQANILLVEAKSEDLNNLIAAVDYARKAPGVSVVSMSWGMSEFSGETSYDSHFLTPKGHQGVTFVAASGDDGAGFDPSWPSISSNVLSVGGTTLNLNTAGGYGTESAWRYSSGGQSRYETAPGYQSGVTSSTHRTAPDVSFDANPGTGFAIYDSLSYQGDRGWQVLGGTSAGTPQWAALVAIADQGRTLQGTATLDGATGTLPALYSLYNNSGVYSAAFHDIQTGGAGGGGFGWHRRFMSATPVATGYDTVTGLGTPQAGKVVGSLIGITIASSKASAKSSAAVKAALAKTAKAQVVSESQAAMLAAAPASLFSAKPIQSLAMQIIAAVSPASAIKNGIASPTSTVINQVREHLLGTHAEMNPDGGSNAARPTADAALASKNNPFSDFLPDEAQTNRSLRLFLFEQRAWLIFPRISAGAADATALAAKVITNYSFSAWKQFAALVAAVGVVAMRVRDRARDGTTRWQ